MSPLIYVGLLGKAVGLEMVEVATATGIGKLVLNVEYEGWQECYLLACSDWVSLHAVQKPALPDDYPPALQLQCGHLQEGDHTRR